MFQLVPLSRLGVLLALCAFLLVSIAPAQTVTGSITGTVVDSSGAVVPGSTVTLTSAGGTRRTQTTTGAGEFIFVAVPPGIYSVKVENRGFGPVIRTGVTLTANERAALGNVELAVGQASDAVTVTAERIAINTEGADVSNTISSSQLKDLLIKGREPMNLVKLLPGVAQTGGGDAIGGVFGTQSPQINGIRNRYNNLTIDGVRGADVNVPDFIPSGVTAEMLAEITVLSSAYSAETGPNPG